ncbi:PIN domain-containing protein [Rhodocollybia butyracea]|uniref:PIN domain-containing protein n=1 Tax=Rhodocollybia butyracea TaxID=206335 RepID=A0A9P5QAG0_9AGAR|nr:PIN domain-containing protein [Rhodocollybia butyracea]
MSVPSSLQQHGPSSYTHRNHCYSTNALSRTSTRNLQTPLEQFSTFANEDVEMLAPAESSFFVVPDTNILIHHLDALVTFTEDIERLDLRLIIVIPSAVISELDWQKKNSWFSRKASVWLWDKIKAQHKKVLKGQSRNDCLRTTCESNDEKIIDCALFFAEKQPTVLCSADRNLCINAVAQAEGNTDAKLGIMNPDDHLHWSSSVLGLYIFGPVIAANFTGWRPAYTEVSRVIARIDDGMEVDTEEDQLYQSDACTLLHFQIIDVFVGLLRELVASDQRDHQRQANEGASASMHAPSTSTSVHALKRNVQASDMNVHEILDYLEYAPSGRANLQGNPSLSSFLSKPYQAHTGWRRGNDWSKKDWLVSLQKLQKIGKAWGDKGEETVNTLHFHLLPRLQHVFSDDKIVI